MTPTIVGANEGSVSTVWSAEGKRPEFVGAKRAQAPLQGACATIERTESNPAGCAIEKPVALHG